VTLSGRSNAHPASAKLLTIAIVGQQQHNQCHSLAMPAVPSVRRASTFAVCQGGRCARAFIDDRWRPRIIR